jgi:hypothetical protein
MSPIRDLAALYGVETRALKQAVKRNVSRLPSDFMFQLSQEEQNSGVVRNFRIAGVWFPKRSEWKRRLQSIKER